MPSTITHAYFALDVVKTLPFYTREFLYGEDNYLKIFGQSMDVLFFYNITNLKKGKRIRQFGHYFHEHNSQDFFINIINYIKYNSYQNNPSIMSLLYGLICHYVLDTTIHPYVLYKTGIFDKNDPTTYIYAQCHEHMETFIDNYLLLQREKQIPYHIKPHQFALPSITFTDEIKEVLNYAFKETFDINNMSRFYEKALQQMRFFYRYFRYDRFGIKKKGYQFIDHFTKPGSYRLEVLSYHIKPTTDKWDYLNTNRHKWNHPLNINETYDLSFRELYIISIKKANKLITEVNKYIYDDQKISLKRLFPNLSYVTGKKENSKKTEYHFNNEIIDF